MTPSEYLGHGKCSSFGGPDDGGVGQMEELALIEIDDLSEWWFSRCFTANVGLGHTIGLARSLNPSALYCAMRWAEGKFNGAAGDVLPGYSRDHVRRGLIRVNFEDKFVFVQAVDWGPNTDTGRFIDLSPGALAVLGAKTDDIVFAAFYC